MLRTLSSAKEFVEGTLDRSLVPTMGALHQGHAALMRAARADGGPVVVSIFVNPLQFGPSEDLSTYPRNEPRDLELCEGEGVEAVFAPSAGEMIASIATTVSVSGVSEGFEGRFRPGHFDGVATIVLKLLNVCAPARAYFGLKDLQQCAVVFRMVRDLHVPVEIRTVETVRESSGLAMSSRNEYLSAGPRWEAGKLFRTIADLAACEAFVSALSEVRSRSRMIGDAKAELARHGFEVDYLDVVNPTTMLASGDARDELRVVVAARFHGVRLIDNVPIRAQPR